MHIIYYELGKKKASRYKRAVDVKITQSLYSCFPGEQPLATVESYIQDATALLSTITQPSLDILPKYQEAITLLSQAENLLAAAHSLKTKLIQGLEISGEKVKKIL